MGDPQPFIALKPDQRGRHFLPTDVLLGTDGSLFLSDFYNSTSRRTVQVSGTIYRITRKDGKPLKRPHIDFESVAGCLKALHSPAVNVRSHAAAQLIARGESAQTQTAESLNTCPSEDDTKAARHLWCLAHQGDTGQDIVATYLTSTNEQLQITAYRALRLADPDGMLNRAKDLARSLSMAVRREVAVSLRDTPWADCQDILNDLIAGYNGRNRYYLEALGAACTGKEAETYEALVRHQFGPRKTWSNTPKNLAWRLHPPAAIEDLDQVIRTQKPPVDEFRHLAMAFASYRNDAERTERSRRLTALALLPEFAAEPYQVTVQEILAKDLNGLKAEPLKADYRMPEYTGTSEISDAKTVAALPGDTKRGQTLAAACYTCHKIGSLGVPFGPNLTHWGRERSIEEIAVDLIDPSARHAHGYDKPVRLHGNGHVAEGLLSNYSWHAGSLKIKLLGGRTLKVPFRRTGTKVENLTRSWMPSASALGLSDQDVRDICEYLKRGIQVQPTVTPTFTGPGDTTAPGWDALDGEDFVNVNCHDDTWRWEGGHAFCTGRPTGVIRYREPLVNFEFTCEWMHKKHGGNSGVFVWATPDSIARLAAGHGRLPHGIEVQVLDLGYAEVYKKRHKKPADWFTSHGDVFPVGPVKMRPFPPVAPNGRRSFPSKNTTKGTNQWNHYFVRAVDGEVRLWVNGEEVSGGDQISPASGYLCLESEGAPIEFKNLRLRKLPSDEEPDAELPMIEALKPITLKEHAILGTWHYWDTYTREITADGFCVLRNGDEVIWKRRCTSKAPNRLIFEGNLEHVLKDDELHIEGKYQAKRKSQK